LDFWYFEHCDVDGRPTSGKSKMQLLSVHAGVHKAVLVSICALISQISILPIQYTTSEYWQLSGG